MLNMVNTAVIGVGEYRISAEEADVLDARWISSGWMSRLRGAIGTGRARGDTSNGFPGDYHVQYFDGEGNFASEYDLHIEPAGDCYQLTWRRRPESVSPPADAGDVVFEGIGFPTGDRSMVLAYWMPEKAMPRP